MSLKKHFKKFVFSFILLLFFCNTSSLFKSYSLANSLDINARSYIVLDRKSKQVIIGKNEYSKVKMASTTKIMTATIIIENCNLNDIVTISKKAAGTGGSRLGLKANDKISVLNLLYGLLLCSGNDAAVALAEHCSGSVTEFCNLMNQKAYELGLANSHFESPHGLDSDNHYTTAYELALITNYALHNEIFSNIVGTQRYTVTINNYSKELHNSNELLGSTNGVYGVKTGFTNGANRCLVTACKRNDMDIICVVLGCDTKKLRGQDSTKLINYCFDNFRYINVEEILSKKLDDWRSNNINYFNISKGYSNNLCITYENLKTPVIPINKEYFDNLDVKFSITSQLFAPVWANSIIGQYEISSPNGVVANGNIIATNTVHKKKAFFYFFNFFKYYSKILNSINF